ncbi:shikimate kinase [soil metagenome]
MSSSSPVSVLIGPPGAGKTAIGAAVADRLGVGFLDTDAVIEATAARSISDIFVEDGEATFRQLELDTVLAALAEHDGVVSLGGGAVMTVAVAQALASPRYAESVVFLDVGIADAASRVGFDASRPMLVINPRASWNRLMKARRPTYERLAHLHIDTAGRGVDDIRDEIVAALGHS